MKQLILLMTLVATFVPSLQGEVLMIFGSDNRPPKYYNRNDIPSGFVVEMTDYIMQQTNQDYLINLYPWKRAYQLSLRGDGALIGLSKNKDRLALFDYSKAMYYTDLMLIVRKNNQFKFENMTDLEGKTISVVRGGSYGDEFEKAVQSKSFKKHEHSDPVMAINLLLRGDVDAVVYGPGKYGVEKLLLRNPKLLKDKKNITILKTPFKRDANYLGIPKQLNMTEFIKAFNKGIDKGYKTGVFDEIIQRHYIH